MKRLLMIIALFTSPLIAMARTDVGISINIGEPGYYGQLQLGNLPPPPVMFANPILVQPAPQVVYPPLYLRVPEKHYKNWRKYCGRYNACGRPVYFVKDDWYRNDYSPRYRREHGHAYGHRDDHRDNGRGHGRGNGHGHGHGHKDRDDNRDER